MMGNIEKKKEEADEIVVEAQYQGVNEGGREKGRKRKKGRMGGKIEKGNRENSTFTMIHIK